MLRLTRLLKFHQQNPTRRCSLCSSNAPDYTLHAATPSHGEGEGDGETTSQDKLSPLLEECSDRTDTGKALHVLSTLPEPDLSMLRFITRKMAANIVSHRERYGVFRTVEDLLMIPGIGRRTFEKVSRSMSNEEGEKKTSRIDSQSTALADLSRERLSSLQDVVSVEIGLKHIAWLHMDRERWVHRWICRRIEGISPGKWDPINYLRLVSDVIEEMPRPNLYILEHKSFTSLNKGTFQTMLFMRCLEAMFFTCLNKDITDSGEVRAVSMTQNIIGRHFDLLVGGQRRSGQLLTKELIREGFERRNTWFPVCLGHDNAAKFEDANRYEREHLSNALLKAVAFYDIYVDKKPGFTMK